MPETLTRPVPQVCHGLCRGCAVQLAPQVLRADHPQYLDVDYVRCRLLDLGGQTCRDLTGPRRVCDNLE